MRCGRVERLLTPYLDGRLEPDARSQVDEHLAACSACRGALAVLRASSTALGAVGPAEPPPGLAARVTRAALARARRGAPALSWLERLFPAVWPAAATATVAALALLVTLGVRAPAAPGPDDLLEMSDPVAEVVSQGSEGLEPAGLVAAVLEEEGD
jgi:anti-sigma factor RsiW